MDSSLRNRRNDRVKITAIASVFLLLAVASYFGMNNSSKIAYHSSLSAEVSSVIPEIAKKAYPLLDRALYDQKMEALANYPKPATSTASTTITLTHKWPVRGAYPKDGALLPFNRIVAYYGNFYSKGMGILGEYDSDTVLSKLQIEVDKWKVADPTTPVIPAIHYIVTTAQGSPGADGKYRLRMPASQIDKALELAKKKEGIVFLDVQIALSTLQNELPPLEKYLSLENVHLGIDPEFSMKTGAKPGTVIGTMDATDINYTIDYLADLVKKNNLPPKILVIHRFTRPMITNYKNIKSVPEVQVVIDMDGWGGKSNKISTYKAFVASEPIQFTGFKLFYKNDTKATGTSVLTPGELLKLNPKPIYIQYQ